MMTKEEESQSSIMERILRSVSLSNDTEYALKAVFREFDFKYYSFHLQAIQFSDVENPFVRTNYPPEWVSRYLLRNYITMDPVAREGFKRVIPFDWRELNIDEKARVVMEDARKHALGRHGYSIPVVDRDARRSLFSFTSDLEDEAWDDFILINRETLAEVASAVHRRALVEALGDVPDLPALGPRELECLMWTARGKDYLDIAEILGISGHTVRGYLKSARFKLECVTLPQAVAKALKLGLIRV